jgi:DNA-binding HxlR family transcriptional regulator
LTYLCSGTYQFESAFFLVSGIQTKGLKSQLCSMKRYNLNGTFYYCPVDLTLQIVGGRWKGIVIWNLREEKKRFSELKRILVTINDKMLSQVLKELEEQGIVNRKVCEVVPPKVEYSLTPEGEKLLPIMQAMNDYGQKFVV